MDKKVIDKGYKKMLKVRYLVGSRWRQWQIKCICFDSDNSRTCQKFEDANEDNVYKKESIL